MDAQAKQQIVERVKQATNILVTVSANPSVDQLAACIGLTLLLNKMDKHTTAVFSGKVPSTLEFLQPEKTIETNTDSLQDFIISLDKNKADKLRYKVEDKVVRIFITPYRTSLSQKDLIFSQGDFNVEVVIALGIKDRSQIDQAIASHGRILHDATVISINAGPGTAPQLGQLNWQDPAASSLSEMLVSVSEAFGAGLIDNQMATAFLTGIVAETQRFSNARTSPKVMTMAAQLMAAGANQQLIVSKLEPVVPMPPKAAPPPPPPPPLPLPAKMPTPKAAPPPAAKPPQDGALDISHQPTKTDSPPVEISPNEIMIDRQGNLSALDISKLKKAENGPPAPEPEAPTAPVVPPPQAPVAQPTPVTPPPLPPLPPLPPPPRIRPINFNSSTNTTEPHTLLNPEDNHPTMSAPFSADMQQEWMDPASKVSTDPLSDGPNSQGLFQRPPAAEPLAATQAATVQPPPDGVDSARSAVQNALAATPFDPGFAAPVNSLNAQVVGPDLHAPIPPASTPSLSLPSNTNGAISATTPYSPPPSDIAPAAPPPVPPPLPLSSNPGAMLPNNPTYQPPQN